MAQNLGEFKDEVRRAHKRGTALDSSLNGAIRRAARFIESNYTLQYMRRRFSIQLAAGVTEIEIPNVNIKAFLTPIRWSALDKYGGYQDCVKTEFASVSATRNAEMSVPEEFYLDGTSTIVFPFNYAGAETLTGTGLLARFTDFPKQDADRHWLIENGEGALLVQTMKELGIISRDERTYAMYQGHWQEHITVMLNADTEAQYAGQDLSL